MRGLCRSLIFAVVVLATCATGVAGPAGALPAPSVTSLSASFSETEWIRLDPTDQIGLTITGTYRGEVVLGLYTCPHTTGNSYLCTAGTTWVQGLPGRGGLPESFTLTKVGVSAQARASAGDLTVPTTGTTGYGASAWTATIFDGLTIGCAGYGQRSTAEWDYLWEDAGACAIH